MGNNILDVIDMFVGTIFLLAVCFVESVVLNLDVGWQRLTCALKTATLGNLMPKLSQVLFSKVYRASMCR